MDLLVSLAFFPNILLVLVGWAFISFGLALYRRLSTLEDEREYYSRYLKNHEHD